MYLVVCIIPCVLSCWLEPWEYAVRGEIIAIGNTSGGGLFSASVMTGCRVQFEDGTIQAMPVSGNAMVGQIVYKHCWVKDGQEWFYHYASPNNRGCVYKYGGRYYNKPSDDSIERLGSN